MGGVLHFICFRKNVDLIELFLKFLIRRICHARFFNTYYMGMRAFKYNMGHPELHSQRKLGFKRAKNFALQGRVNYGGYKL